MAFPFLFGQKLCILISQQTILLQFEQMTVSEQERHFFWLFCLYTKLVWPPKANHISLPLRRGLFLD